LQCGKSFMPSMITGNCLLQQQAFHHGMHETPPALQRSQTEKNNQILLSILLTPKALFKDCYQTRKSSMHLSWFYITS
jgi:hypothetical protein